MSEYFLRSSNAAAIEPESVVATLANWHKFLPQLVQKALDSATLFPHHGQKFILGSLALSANATGPQSKLLEDFWNLTARQLQEYVIS
jgi:hypothetical protein